jgi:hypothetical protein
MMTSIRPTGTGHPLFEKFTPEHIDKFLDYSHDDDGHNYELAKQGKLYNLIYFVVGLLFLVFLIVYLLPSNKDLLIDLIRLLIVFGGGFGAGYGVKSLKGKEK